MKSRRFRVKKRKKSRRLKRGLFLGALLLIIAFAGTIAAGNILREQAVPANTSGISVDINHIPEYVSQAFIAVEDERYYYHFGVDPIGMVRALIADIQAKEFVQGGSTITMQAARNIYLSHDKTIIRKVKEIMIAVNLEWYYSKEEILELYVNHIYFGQGNYGVEQAANAYFNKTTMNNHPELELISPEEAAVLAGIVKSPEYYANNLDKAQARGELVYEKMEKLGYLQE